MSDFEWNDATIFQLRQLWAEGLSTIQIGRRMGISKNAVVGKAHRIGLAERPSPIIRTGEPRKPAPPPRVKSIPLPVLASVAAPVAISVPVRRRTPVLPPPVAAAPPKAVVPIKRVGSATCCFPLGDKQSKNLHFCEDAALLGKPYCQKHHDVAFVKVRERREATYG